MKELESERQIGYPDPGVTWPGSIKIAIKLMLLTRCIVGRVHSGDVSDLLFIISHYSPACGVNVN